MGIKQPPPYVHPKKANDAPAPVVIDEGKRAASARALKPVRPIRKDGRKVLLRLVARPPQPGTIPLYDDMIKSGLEERQAMLALLRRGSERLERLLDVEPAGFRKLTYPTDGKPIETNRSIDINLMQSISDRFNPYSALTARAFGLKLGEALIVMAVKKK